MAPRENEPARQAPAADPLIDAYKQHVDRTLLRENLRLTTAQRVEKMMAALRFAEQVRASRVKRPTT